MEGKGLCLILLFGVGSRQVFQRRLAGGDRMGDIGKVGDAAAIGLHDLQCGVAVIRGTVGRVFLLDMIE